MFLSDKFLSALIVVACVVGTVVGGFVLSVFGFTWYVAPVALLAYAAGRFKAF